ncbi:TetR/AcrR family transcriptional regulator [Turicibacter sp. TS3]|uniref:TetR/AcrR family transcriptional regulator n=1 Tax=Turicibacter sp. TS3 TaxID=2304578 RepID=UPI00137A1FC4|nr:TetR/AcrR family transcriptional regulator [Turicibacter sp. TS3]NCE78888.1 TetR/AcrR family transcriptional regulator [Turicibacter sp. TS3]
METTSELSKLYLSEALIQLMKTKDFAKITNKNITDRAGLSHITIYRHFDTKEEILSYYLARMFKQWKEDWQEGENMAYQFFTFFQRHQEIIDLLYRAGKQYLLIDQLLASYDYGREDSNAVAYSKVTVAYFIFGWCDEWYKRGMVETPAEMAKLCQLR